MRSLGEFFGHIAQGVKTPAAGAPATPRPASTVSPAPPEPSAAPPEPQRRVLRETVEEEQRDTPQGKVTLRRTIVEEVELPPQDPSRGQSQAQ